MLKFYIILFFIYSFGGWVGEVLVKLYENKKFINRGFLIGPICPIYGAGAIMMTFFLGGFDKDPLLLFFLAVILCSSLEYVTSYVLERIFKARWWDYSRKKLNINGRVYLGTMIPFGILALLMTYILNPFIRMVLNKVDGSVLSIISIILLLLFLIDIIISVNILLKFKKTVILTGKDNTEQMALLKKKEIKNDRMYQYKLLNIFPSALQMEKFIRENYSKTKEIINDKQVLLKKKTEIKINALKSEYERKVNNIKNKTATKIKKMKNKK